MSSKILRIISIAVILLCSTNAHMSHDQVHLDISDTNTAGIAETLPQGGHRTKEDRWEDMRKMDLARMKGKDESGEYDKFMEEEKREKALLKRKRVRKGMDEDVDQKEKVYTTHHNGHNN